MDNQIPDPSPLKVSPKLREDLRIAAKWARIVVLIGGASTLISIASNIRHGKSSFLGTIFMLGVAVVFYLFIYRFGTHVQKGLDESDQASLNEGFNNLNIFFKILGAILIFAFSLVVLAIVFTSLGAMIMGK